MATVRALLVFGLLVGCTHAPVESAVRPEPVATTRVSASPSSPSSPPSSSVSTPASSSKVGKAPSGSHTCEPFVRCGVWSKCAWFEHLPGERWRVLGGPTKGAVFVRRHQCGMDGCALHCPGGTDCYDALHPADEACTEVAPLGPNATHCSVGDGVCGSLM